MSRNSVSRFKTPMLFAALFLVSLAGALLEEHKMAVVPGEDFLGSGSRCVRISFACSDEQIREGMARLKAFVDSLV